jgi:hypothetical protein
MSSFKFASILLVGLLSYQNATANEFTINPNCQCVEYVKRVIGVPPTVGVGNAKDMGKYLLQNGYSKVDLSANKPSRQDIMILLPSYGNGIDPTYGHVGILSAARQVGKDITVSLVSANLKQPNERFDHMCENVSTLSITIPQSKFGSVEFYRN